MKSVAMQFAMVLATMVLFIVMLILNEWMFASLNFSSGISWVYLPAGVRLLCTLLFAEAGAVGLLLVSWLACFFYFFPHDWLRSFAGGIISTVAPYGMYRLAQWHLGLNASLKNLTPQRLLGLSFAYALANAVMHHLWFVIYGDGGSWQGLLVMLLGDFNGSLLVLYFFKLVLLMAPKDRSRYELQ